MEQPAQPSELNSHLTDPPKQEEQKERGNVAIFFRIWFGLNQSELVKTAIGSFAAALSGISKPVFGFFIMTIGVAYYESDSKQKVGWYSLIFSSIGLLSLFSHTLQHYFFGLIGEKAMTNLRKALYSGIALIYIFVASSTSTCTIFMANLIAFHQIYIKFTLIIHGNHYYSCTTE